MKKKTNKLCMVYILYWFVITVGKCELFVYILSLCVCNRDDPCIYCVVCVTVVEVSMVRQLVSSFTLLALYCSTPDIVSDCKQPGCKHR